MPGKDAVREPHLGFAVACTREARKYTVALMTLAGGAGLHATITGK